MEEEFPRYQTSLANVYGCSQNQSQGIELDVHKENVCDETKGMGLAEMINGGWLCGEDTMERGGLAGGVGWHGCHRRQPLELNESTKILLTQE